MTIFSSQVDLAYVPFPLLSLKLLVEWIWFSYASKTQSYKLKLSRRKLLSLLLCMLSYVLVSVNIVTHNGYIYELWRILARTFLDKNWFWEIRRIFQVRTDQAIAYILCCSLFFLT